jgi:hypothetical protein
MERGRNIDHYDARKVQLKAASATIVRKFLWATDESRPAAFVSCFASEEKAEDMKSRRAE